MQRNIQSTSKMFNSHVNDITKLLHGYRHFTDDMIKPLEKLGYVIKKCRKHYKCFYNNLFVTIIASTPSDAYAGNQIIRHFRTFWEKYECSNTK